MPPADPVLRAWWPTTQALDLVEAPCETAARAVANHYDRFAEGAGLGAATLAWIGVASLDAALSQASDFDNVATVTLILPTRSRWSVMWNNSFLCDGYDSLCHCLTRFDGLTTIHWSAHDDWTTFQSGATFHWRSPTGERRVQAAQTDRRWDWFAHGDPLPEEDVAGYGARRKRDRLNESRLLALLERLGARPWSAEFYALPGQIAKVSRPRPAPATVRSRDAVLASAKSRRG